MTRRRTLVWVLAGSPFLLAPPARAALPDRLYTAVAIVTGYDMRSRPAGFAQCLTEVLIKLTGDPSLADDARVKDVAHGADKYVADFNYVDPIANIKHHDDQGTYDRSYNLTVRFDRAKIDALVAALGRKLWTEERPVIAPVIRMISGQAPWAGDFVMAEDQPKAAAQRGALANAAASYGVQLALPKSADVAALRESESASPARMVIIGTLQFRPEDFGWSGSWRTRWSGAEHSASVRGVGFDLAFDHLVRGAVALAAGTGPFG